MEVSFNGAEEASVDLMRRWLDSLGQSVVSSLVPLHTYGILCKSKDDMLFPLLCCNAGALPAGMEIRDERGHFARNAAYVSPVLSAAVPDGESYRCERVLELPDDVKRSLENVCLFFHTEEPIQKSNLRDFRDTLKSLDKYSPYDLDIQRIHWLGTNLINDLAISADAETDLAIVDKNRKKSLWEIAESVDRFRQTIKNKIDSLLKILPSEKDFPTRNERRETLEALQAALDKLSIRDALDIASLADEGSASVPATETVPLDKFSPQERFSRDLQSLYTKYGFHPPIGRVRFMGKRLIETLNDPKNGFSTQSSYMIDCEKILSETIMGIENDLEDLHPDKSDRIAKLKDLLTDLKALQMG